MGAEGGRVGGRGGGEKLVIDEDADGGFAVHGCGLVRVVCVVVVLVVGGWGWGWGTGVLEPWPRRCFVRVWRRG